MLSHSLYSLHPHNQSGLFYYMKTGEQDKQHVTSVILINNIMLHVLWAGKVTDVCITCCTFGVLTLLLRSLPLAVSASFTVTALKEKKNKTKKNKKGESLN